jgi:Pyruvate/2-oxoacid:ferredoxin oxidoreductase delta subunit
MHPDRRDKIRAGVRKACNNCPKCGGFLETVDAKRVDGLPGIGYRYCNGCGYCRAITRRSRKTDLSGI